MSKTVDVKKAEHKRLKSRSHKQFKFGLKIVAFLLICFLATLLLFPKSAVFVFAILVVFSITTAMEYRNWKRHEKALHKKH